MAEPPTLSRLVDRLVLVAPIRFALGGAGAVLAWAAGGKGSVVAAAFAFGCIGLAAVALGERRAVLLGPAPRLPVPPGARFTGRLRTALAATLPSTVGMTVFVLLALIVQPTLAALLAGGIAGLGVAGLASGLRLELREREEGVELYVTGSARVLYERPRPAGAVRD